MNVSLYSCKQFLKDFKGDDYDVSFTPENIDVIASEMSRTNTQFTFEKVRMLIQKLNNEGRLEKPKENQMKQTDQERGALFSFYVTSKWAHPAVDYDSLQTLTALTDRCSRENYPVLEVRHII